jgi:peptidoglycan-associated lipoprotein
MEITMFQSAKILTALVGAIALSALAGCAEPAPPPPLTAAAADPELAGIWYQVYFGTNSVDVDARGQMIVKNVAYVVANNNTTRVTVIGKTDRVGAPSANMALSERRADGVRQALITAGVPAARIDTSWTGELRQQVATVDEAADQRNRVVDITVVKQPR